MANPTTGPWVRTDGLVTITRTVGGIETITGHDFCAYVGDAEGIANARVVEAGLELLAGLQTAADLLETEGYDVASLRASITKATGPTE